jgi:hypothetical protein
MASVTKVIAISTASQALPAAERITQSQLSEFIEARNVLARLKERVGEMEASIRTRLESGADVQPGVHVGHGSARKSRRDGGSFRTAGAQRLRRLIGTS